MKDDLSAASIRKALATRYVGRNLIYLDSTTSTQDRARREAEAGAPEGTTVVADEQTAGRGRFQRSWLSPRGRAIYLSLVLRPGPAELLKLNMVASLAVARAVHAVTGLGPKIKWPNDVQLSGKKLAGMLIDTAMRESSVDYAVVGIGLNVGLDPSQHPEIADIATSLSWEMQSPVQRLPVLSALLLEMEKALRIRETWGVPDGRVEGPPGHPGPERPSDLARGRPKEVSGRGRGRRGGR